MRSPPASGAGALASQSRTASPPIDEGSVWLKKVFRSFHSASPAPRSSGAPHSAYRLRPPAQAAGRRSEGNVTADRRGRSSPGSKTLRRETGLSRLILRSENTAAQREINILRVEKQRSGASLARALSRLKEVKNGAKSDAARELKRRLGMVLKTNLAIACCRVLRHPETRRVKRPLFTEPRGSTKTVKRSIGCRDQTDIWSRVPPVSSAFMRPAGCWPKATTLSDWTISTAYYDPALKRARLDILCARYNASVSCRPISPIGLSMGELFRKKPVHQRCFISRPRLAFAIRSGSHPHACTLC